MEKHELEVQIEKHGMAEVPAGLVTEIFSRLKIIQCGVKLTTDMCELLSGSNELILFQRGVLSILDLPQLYIDEAVENLEKYAEKAEASMEEVNHGTNQS